MRQGSNRTYHRILMSLSIEVARRYGYRPESETEDLERRLAAATVAKDWQAVSKLAAKLKNQNGESDGQTKTDNADTEPE
jgi:hypothetical protein